MYAAVAVGNIQAKSRFTESDSRKSSGRRWNFGVR